MFSSYLELRTMDKIRNTVILNVIFHHHNHLEAITSYNLISALNTYEESIMFDTI
jgi:hypothetical protein